MLGVAFFLIVNKTILRIDTVSCVVEVLGVQGDRLNLRK